MFLNKKVNQCYGAEIIYFWLRLHLCPLFRLRLLALSAVLFMFVCFMYSMTSVQACTVPVRDVAWPCPPPVRNLYLMCTL